MRRHPLPRRMVGAALLAVLALAVGSGCELIPNQDPGQDPENQRSSQRTESRTTNDDVRREDDGPKPVGYPLAKGRVVEPTGHHDLQVELTVGDLVVRSGDWKVGTRDDPTGELAYAERRGEERVFQAVRPGTVKVWGPLDPPEDLCDGCDGMPEPENLTVTIVAKPTGYPLPKGKLVRPTNPSADTPVTLAVGDLVEVPSTWKPRRRAQIEHDSSYDDSTPPAIGTLARAESRDGTDVYQATKPGIAYLDGPFEPRPCPDGPCAVPPPSLTVTITGTR